jgi:hypothetical protein
MKSPIIILTMALLLQTFTGYAMEAGQPQYSENPLIEQIAQECAKKHGAKKADPKIQELVQEALNKCGITRPIIIMQRNYNPNSYVYSNPIVHPQEFLLVGLSASQDENGKINYKTLDEITADVYHEIGHLHHGDMQISRVYTDKFLALTTMFVAPIASMSLTFMKSPFESKILSGITALGAGFAASLGSFFATIYSNSLRESRADKFAYSKLLEHGKLDIALDQVYEWLRFHETRPRDLPPCVGGYPISLNRARMGLQIIKDNGHNISELIKDPDNSKLKRSIEKFLPEFLDN